MIAALSHPLNLVLLASSAVSAAWVGDWRPLAVAAAAEVVWLGLHAYMTRPQPAAQVPTTEQEKLRRLGEPGRRRFLELDRVRRDIRRLSAGNQNLTDAGVGRDLVRIDGVLDAWLDLAVEASERRAILEREANLGAEQQLRSGLSEIDLELERVAHALTDLRGEIMDLSTPDTLRARLGALQDGMEAATRTARSVRSLELPAKGG